MNSSIAVLLSIIIIVLIIITIKLLRHIIHRYFPDTTTTTTNSLPSTLSSLPPPSPQPQINQIIRSPPPQIRTHSLRFLFNNNQISPTPNLQSNQHNMNLINSLPTFRFEAIKGIRQSSSSISSSETPTATATLDCAICITRFEKQDQLRLLPSCCHVFHSHCIDQWILLSNYNCPICRSDVKLSVDDDDDDDGELKMISSSARSFRIEIGSVSRSSRIEIGSFSASDLQNRSYSLGSFEYWVQEFDAEVFVELERINENRAQSDEVSVSVGGASGGDVEDAAAIVVENPVGAESDEAEAYATSLSYSLQFSDRFHGGNGLRSGGGMDEGGGGSGGGRVWDLEGNQFGEEISGFFGFLSRA